MRGSFYCAVPYGSCFVLKGGRLGRKRVDHAVSGCQGGATCRNLRGGGGIGGGSFEWVMLMRLLVEPRGLNCRTLGFRGPCSSVDKTGRSCRMRDEQSKFALLAAPTR